MKLNSKIEKLDDHVINQIKAGEVIERPLNVIKEVLENAIDAGATDIKIEILDAGKKLIKVSDNGTGILSSQVELAFMLHTTSKIHSFEDLERLKDFGFRGEALASIASVSKMTIRTRHASEELGVEYCFEEGLCKDKKSISMNVGTQIEVKDLFFNTPVRLKFLKSTSTEYSHIYDYLFAMVLAWPKIAFDFIHNSRTVFRFSSRDNLDFRMQKFLSFDFKNYSYFEFERGSFKVKGYLCLPEFCKSIPKFFVTVLNGRYVKDRVIRQAVYQGYLGLIIKGQSPSVVLFLDMSPSWVDFNAHPTKTEVRFKDVLSVQELISIAIQNNLKTHIRKSISHFSDFKGDTKIAESSPYSFSKEGVLGGVGVNKKLENPAFSDPLMNAFKSNTINDSQRLSKANEYSDDREKDESLLIIKDSKFKYFGDYIGQFANCYLLIEKDKNLFIVDQHAFHERIIFEDLIQAHKDEKILKQGLLNPMLILLNEYIVELLKEFEALITKLGFEVEFLTEGKIAIHSYPSFLETSKVGKIFDEIISRVYAISNSQARETHPLLLKGESLKKSLSFDTQNTSISSDKVYHLFFATMACHSAIRSGEPMNTELVRRLMRRATDVDFYAHCPHGRPVLVKFKEREVASWFLRT